MKPIILVCLFAALVSGTRAERLSAADREALLGSLEKLQNDAESKVEARFRAAAAAYREALNSEDALIDLYLKCVEKVEFTDQEKKPSEFRSWKRAHTGQLADPMFRRALGLQLRWLMLYLRSGADGADREALAAEGQEIVDAIFRDAAEFRGQQQLLGQAVTSSIFARAYEIGNPERIKWPQAPLQVESFYEQVVFPLVRNPDGIERLRAAWTRRIQLEGIRLAEWTGNGTGRKNALAETPPSREYEQFLAETLPDLQWQMEMDLFRAGDEAGAARRMLDHLGRHLRHRSARAWTEQFKAILTPKVP